MPMIFVTLPVRDLPVARAFYEALDFRVNEYSSDETTAAVVVDDTIVVRLVTREAFAELVAGEVGDPARVTSVVNCLTVSDRALVDQLVATALASGGKPGLPARDEETSYTGSFTDPDGHVWQLMWMDQLHVVN
jgi:predicted lactoylglutathione lyase